MNNYNGLKAISLVFSLSVIGQAQAAEHPSVAEIVRQTEHSAYYLGEDGRANVTMTITDAQGRERKRRLTILRRDAPGDNLAGKQQYYIHIGYPSDIKNTVLMVWKNPGQDDDRWLYLPGLDLVKRIAASDKRTSFLGSNFYYEDISGRATALDRHALVETTENFYVIKNTPKQPETVEFSHYVMWVHRVSHLPIKVEFFDKQGSKARVYEALKVETIQGHPTVVQSRMRDLALGQNTVLDFRRIRYDTGIDATVFTERHLRNPPRAALR